MPCLSIPDIRFLQVFQEENPDFTTKAQPFLLVRFPQLSRISSNFSGNLEPKRGEDGTIIDENCPVRYNKDNMIVSPSKVDYIDVSPSQIVSVTTSMIPFMEHDDANRTLMGANMQRQAVPLMITEAPIVGTGVEAAIARDSGCSVVSDIDGVIESYFIPSHENLIKSFPNKKHIFPFINPYIFCNQVCPFLNNN